MQEAGVKVIPDIVFGGRDAESYMLAGIPKGSKTVAKQVQTGRKDDAWRELTNWGFKKIVDEIAPESIILYVGETWEDDIDMDIFPSELHVQVVLNRLQARTPVMRSANKTLKVE
jgi:hypothetical protein